MSTRFLLLVVVAALLVAIPATAEIYTITLSNGSEFETRYRPKEANWDETKIMVLTDVGNWIALDKGDIVSVITQTENRGFGKVIDTHTVAIGWAANDAPEATAEEAADPMTRLLNYLAVQDANRPDYSVDQFVEPGDAGMGGLPVSGLVTGPGGASSFVTGNTSFAMSEGGTASQEPNTVDN